MLENFADRLLLYWRYWRIEMEFHDVLIIVSIVILIIVAIIVLVKGRQAISNFRYIRKWGMDAYRYELLLDYIVAVTNPEEYEAMKEAPKTPTRSFEGTKIKSGYYREQVTRYLDLLKPLAPKETIDTIQKFLDDSSAENYHLAIAAMQKISENN